MAGRAAHIVEYEAHEQVERNAEKVQDGGPDVLWQELAAQLHHGRPKHAHQQLQEQAAPSSSGSSSHAHGSTLLSSMALSQLPGLRIRWDAKLQEQGSAHTSNMQNAPICSLACQVNPAGAQPGGVPSSFCSEPAQCRTMGTASAAAASPYTVCAQVQPRARSPLHQVWPANRGR